jgi:hypothetical protein
MKHGCFQGKSRPLSSLGILSPMRLTTPVLALAAAAMLAACGSVAAPKSDPRGDAAFVARLKVLCTKTPALVPIDASASLAAISSAANANNATVTNFVYGPPVAGPHGKTERRGGLSVLTPKISSASPLVPPVAGAAEMLVDMSKWYGLIVKAATTDGTRVMTPAAKSKEIKALRNMADTTVRRETRARSDLAKIGVTSCPT